MASTARLQSDPLFQGLTRPTMIAGVSYMYFVLNGMINMIAFINTQDFLVLLVAAPAVHLVGYIICLKEPRALELFIKKMATGFRCRNRSYHGFTNSYDPF